MTSTQTNLEDAIAPYARANVKAFKNGPYSEWEEHLSQHARGVNAAARMPLSRGYVEEVVAQVARSTWRPRPKSQAQKDQQAFAIKASIIAKRAAQQAVEGLTRDTPVCPCGGTTKATTLELIDPEDKARWLRIPIEEARALVRVYKVQGLQCRGCGRLYGTNGKGF